MTVDLDLLARASMDGDTFARAVAEIDDETARAALRRGQAAIARGGARAAGQLLAAFAGREVASDVETALARTGSGLPVAIRLGTHPQLARPWRFTLTVPGRIAGTVLTPSAVYVLDTEGSLSRFSYDGALTHRRTVPGRGFQPLAVTLEDRLYIGGATGDLSCLDAATLLPEASHPVADGPIRHLAWASGALVLVDARRNLVCWLPDARQVGGRIKLRAAASSVTAGPDGTVIVATDDGEVSVLEVPSLRGIARVGTRLRGPSVAIGRDGRGLVVGRAARLAERLLVRSGRTTLEGAVDVHVDAKRAWSSGRSGCAFVSGDGKLVLVDMVSGEVVAWVPEPTGAPGSVAPWFAVSPDGESCATVNGGDVHVWSVSSLPSGLGSARGRSPVLLRATPSVGVSYHVDQVVRSWSIRDGELVSETDLTSSPPRDYRLDVEPNGRRVFCVGEDGALTVRDLVDGSAVRVLRGPDVTVLRAMVARDIVLVGDADGSVSAWTFAGQRRATVGAVGAPIADVLVSPDESTVGAITTAGRTVVWSDALSSPRESADHDGAWAPSCVLDSGALVRAADTGVEVLTGQSRHGTGERASAVCALRGDCFAAACGEEVVVFGERGRSLRRFALGGMSGLHRCTAPWTLAALDASRVVAIDWETGEELFTWDGFERPVVVDVPTRDRLVLVDANGEVFVFARDRRRA